MHYYAPMVFTHQGLDWSDDPLRDLHDVPFPLSRADVKANGLLRELRGAGRDAAAESSRRRCASPGMHGASPPRSAAPANGPGCTGSRCVLNEFGVLAWKAPAVDRLYWLETVRRAAEQGCIGWTHWDYADAFGFVRAPGRQRKSRIRPS